jgi:hypothetical protein
MGKLELAQRSLRKAQELAPKSVILMQELAKAKGMLTPA